MAIEEFQPTPEDIADAQRFFPRSQSIEDRGGAEVVRLSSSEIDLLPPEDAINVAPQSLVQSLREESRDVMRDVMGDTLVSLEERERQVLLMLYGPSDVKRADVAQAIGCALSTVRRIESRALFKLRNPGQTPPTLH